jgi:hypothetical protein
MCFDEVLRNSCVSGSLFCYLDKAAISSFSLAVYNCAYGADRVGFYYNCAYVLEVCFAPMHLKYCWGYAFAASYVSWYVLTSFIFVLKSKFCKMCLLEETSGLVWLEAFSCGVQLCISHLMHINYYPFGCQILLHFNFLCLVLTL